MAYSLAQPSVCWRLGDADSMGLPERHTLCLIGDQDACAQFCTGCVTDSHEGDVLCSVQRLLSTEGVTCAVQRWLLFQTGHVV